MTVFCLGMAGYLVLLAVDGRERLRLWGRLVTVWQPPRRGTRPRTAAGPGHPRPRRGRAAGSGWPPW